MDLSALYRHRFSPDELRSKGEIWDTLCREFFQNLVGDNKIVLDLACGYGEFINSIRAETKLAVDANPDVRQHLVDGVRFSQSTAVNIPLADASVDVVFTSNFLEHLKTKAECDQVFSEVRRVLRSGGKFIIMGPNIRYLADRYWDFYDHHLPLSHLSLEEGLTMSGFSIEKIWDKFLPYTSKSSLPKNRFFVSMYLKVPIAWRFLGKQFLVVAVK